MNFLALLPIFSSLIDRIFPDKAKQDEAKIELQKALNEAAAQEIQAKKEIITAEISQGGWASQWRAYLMLSCSLMIVCNWLLVPLLNALLAWTGFHMQALAIPTEAWTLMSIGLGGYVGERTVEKYSANKYQGSNKALFDAVRKIKGAPLTQDDVENINKTEE